MKRAKAGFTLIEMMLVIALIGILSAMIIPEMRGSFGDALLRSTSRELVNAFSLANSRAVGLNQAQRFRFERSSGRYRIEMRLRENGKTGEFVPAKDVAGGEGTLDSRIAIGRDPFTFAYLRGNTHRNLYRIPLP